MNRCEKEKCSYLDKYGKCCSVCVERGFAKHITNYDQLKDMGVEQVAMVMAEKILENDRTVKNKVQAVCLKMALYDKCLRWLDSEYIGEARNG